MYCRVIKPAADRLTALVLLLLFTPVILALTLLIYRKMGAPLLFTQQRPGKDGAIFTIYKFRTMTNERGPDGALLSDEARLKGIGKTIRTLSLDELPQLYNVLRGDMSFIGPRPLLIEYLPLYSERQRRRHAVRPGITGWAQINGRNAISWEQKFAFDLYYVEHCSLWLDLRIAGRTIKKVWQREGINADGQATTEKFNGRN